MFHSRECCCSCVSITKRFIHCRRTRKVLGLYLAREKKVQAVSCFHSVVWCQVQSTTQRHERVKSPVELLLLEERNHCYFCIYPPGPEEPVKQSRWATNTQRNQTHPQNEAVVQRLSHWWGQVQCFGLCLASFSLGWSLPARIYPHLPVSKQKASWRCCCEYLWGCSCCSHENQAVVNAGNSLTQTTELAVAEFLSCQCGYIQPFPCLINNLWLGMFYLYLQMKPIFQPDALASQASVTSSEHCVVPSALAHPSSSSRLQEARGYWSLAHSSPEADNKSLQGSQCAKLCVWGGIIPSCWKDTACIDILCANPAQIPPVGTGMKDSPVLLWMYYTRAVVLALCCAAWGEPGPF